MRYLQTRILISYLATLLVSLVAFLAISMTVGYRETRKNIDHLLEMQVEGSIRAYEDGGPHALSQYLQRMDSWFTSTHYLVDAQIPDKMAEWSIHVLKSKWLFLLGLNVVLLFVGGLIEIYAAIVVVVPLLVPIGVAFKIDPVHLGIIFLANMELGFLAPPVGLNLLLSSYRFNKPILEVMRAVIPMLLVLLIGVLLITYFPPLTTFLPRLLK